MRGPWRGPAARRAHHSMWATWPQVTSRLQQQQLQRRLRARQMNGTTPCWQHASITAHTRATCLHMLAREDAEDAERNRGVRCHNDMCWQPTQEAAGKQKHAFATGGNMQPGKMHWADCPPAVCACCQQLPPPHMQAVLCYYGADSSPSYLSLT